MSAPAECAICISNGNKADKARFGRVRPLDHFDGNHYEKSYCMCSSIDVINRGSAFPEDGVEGRHRRGSRCGTCIMLGLGKHYCVVDGLAGHPRLGSCGEDVCLHCGLCAERCPTAAVGLSGLLVLASPKPGI